MSSGSGSGWLLYSLLELLDEAIVGDDLGMIQFRRTARDFIRKNEQIERQSGLSEDSRRGRNASEEFRGRSNYFPEVARGKRVSRRKRFVEDKTFRIKRFCSKSSAEIRELNGLVSGCRFLL